MPPEDRPPGDASRPKGRRCPICGKPAQEATRPFCSKRCRAVDLNRWLSGTYVVPGSDDDEEGD
ncbi:MAG: DNA gyrase inhibitor YacG [Bradyrhizobium sp.]